MGWLTQLALDASIWPLPPPLECVWEILDQRSQRCPISPYWRSRMRSGGKKPSKKGWFFSLFLIFFARGTFQRLLVVSIAYHNFWHKISGRLRPLPTMCGALGSHRIEKIAKKSAQIPPFWWIITIPLHFGELGGVLATLTIKKGLLSEWQEAHVVKFWYVILTTRRLWRSHEQKKPWNG